MDPADPLAAPPPVLPTTGRSSGTRRFPVDRIPVGLLLGIHAASPVLVVASIQYAESSPLAYTLPRPFRPLATADGNAPWPVAATGLSHGERFLDLPAPGFPRDP